MITIFTLANGRSGTKFLYHLFRNNTKNCVCRHEPYLDWGNHTMFGRPIYYHHQGNREAIRALLHRKKRAIRRYDPQAYVETSHAFLKSYYDLALDFFPDMKLVHLIRDPLKTSKSLLNRETRLHQFHIPFRFYKGEIREKYFRWALTGKEPIFQGLPMKKPTLFQKCIIEWIEIENRAMYFLDRFKKQDDCFTLHAPEDLNDPVRIAEMLHFFKLDFRSHKIIIAGNKNRTPGTRTIITAEDRREFEEIVEQLPDAALKIFRKDPYVKYEWAQLFGSGT